MEGIKSIKFFKTYGDEFDLLNYDPMYTCVEIFYDGENWIKRIVHKNIFIDEETCIFNYNNAFVTDEKVDNFDLILNEIKNFNEGELIEFKSKDYLFAPYMGKWELSINDGKILSGSNRISYEGIEKIKDLLSFNEVERNVFYEVFSSIDDKREKIIYAIGVNLFNLDLFNLKFKEKYEIIENLIEQSKKRII